MLQIYTYFTFYTQFNRSANACNTKCLKGKDYTSKKKYISSQSYIWEWSSLTYWNIWAATLVEQVSKLENQWSLSVMKSNWTGHPSWARLGQRSFEYSSKSLFFRHVGHSSGLLLSFWGTAIKINSNTYLKDIFMECTRIMTFCFILVNNH